MSCVEEQLLSERNDFAALRKENMEHEKNIKDYKTKICERCNVKSKTVEKHVAFFIGYFCLLW